MFAFVVCCPSLQLVCAAGLDAVQLQEGESERTRKWSGDRRVDAPAQRTFSGAAVAHRRDSAAHPCASLCLRALVVV